MPKVSVIIPTHNRPDPLKKAIISVLNQTYQDFEIIVVDDGLSKRADQTVSTFADSRVRYIAHEKELGGGAARNTGIRVAIGPFIAFLDDDDEWLPEKLEIQMRKFEGTSHDVGFCFSAVVNVFDEKETITTVPNGIKNYYELALESFNKFLTVTLIVKRRVFDKVGFFDEDLPSHQEAELMIRISKMFNGLGINRPLARVNMMSGHNSIGSSLQRRINGRELVLKRHISEYRKRPKVLARHYFQLGLWYRDDGCFREAGTKFYQALKTDFKFKYLGHLLSLSFGGGLYHLFRKIRNEL